MSQTCGESSCHLLEEVGEPSPLTLALSHQGRGKPAPPPSTGEDKGGGDPTRATALHKEAIEHLDFAIGEFREIKMQPSLERALRHKGLLSA
ncbi:MAG: hypothetical protein HW403_742 [Dehalococcoidia bacterium]|nr:hypothetical protein [Dehalococcoidia bacterium]